MSASKEVATLVLNVNRFEMRQTFSVRRALTTIVQKCRETQSKSMKVPLDPQMPAPNRRMACAGPPQSRRNLRWSLSRTYSAMRESWSRFDLTPYELRTGDFAFGVRVGRSEGYPGGGASFDGLYLFRGDSKDIPDIRPVKGVHEGARRRLACGRHTRTRSFRRQQLVDRLAKPVARFPRTSTARTVREMASALRVVARAGELGGCPVTKRPAK
jgi:hypothetical protein